MMSCDDVLTVPVARRMEVFTGAGRRRRWSAETKARIVAESYVSSAGAVSERYGLAKTQIFTWRRHAKRAESGRLTFAPVVVDEAVASGGRPEPGVIEVELGWSRVQIGRGADAEMAVAVLGALRAGR
jgi:transposase